MQACMPISLRLDGAMSREQFDSQFATEEACADYLIKLRWPEGYSCLRCGSGNTGCLRSRRLPLFVCRDCHYQASPIVGTVMERSSTSLRVWFLICFLSSQSAFRMNAAAISRAASVTYKTAWLILMKLRQAIAASDARHPLTGAVTVNSAFASERDCYSNQRNRRDAPVLIGATFHESGRLHRLKIKLVPLPHMEEKRVLPEGTAAFTERHVTAGSFVRSVTARFTARRNKLLLPHFERALQWVHTTYGGIGKKHLQVYLDEVCFRLCAVHRGKSCFSSFVRLCATTTPFPYAAIVA
ncbi:transposase [Paenibacillus cymbidii]|uniref:transposase n=1 Tax=Paenibacillus cymbidii TaxID=1639034 RepID=UPI00108083CC|nr:transposase [Paenibacillus cymbidii]